jgi:hypothetical protein
MTERNTAKKKTAAAALPAPSALRNPQLDLFQNFLCNTDFERDQLSNTIDLWDSIPRYAMVLWDFPWHSILVKSVR